MRVYSIESIYNSHDFEHGQEFVTLEDHILLAEEYNLLKQKLEKAEEVIRFYANEGHWGIAMPGERVSIDPCDWGKGRGGEKARDYFKEKVEFEFLEWL